MQCLQNRMPPSDKNKSAGNSTSEKDQNQLCSKSCIMDFPSKSISPSTSNVTLSGHKTIINIPWVTASQSTTKCSVNDQMKTVDPEDGGIERLTNSNSGNSVFLGKTSCSVIKNSNKNYKAGSKINKLADMLAKRSQNVVEVKQNSTSDLIIDISSSSKADDNETVIRNSVSNIVKTMNGSLFENSSNGNEFSLYRKSRRKSVPNQTYNLHKWQFQSTSKSCSDLSELLPLEESGKNERIALGETVIKLQTDESTKKKVIRKNFRNVKLPLILPETKRRSTMKTDSFLCSKHFEKFIEEPSVVSVELTNKSIDTFNEVITSSDQSPKPNERCAKVKKEMKVRQRKSNRLVENSTQTGDIEFISMMKSNTEGASEKCVVEESDKPIFTYECLYCSQTFTSGSLRKAHEKTHSVRQLKCQYCSKKPISFEEFKSHCSQKHPSKYAYCVKCDERFTDKEELHSHNKEIHLNKNLENQNLVLEETPPQEKKQEEFDEKADKKISKSSPKPDLKIDVSYDSVKKSSVSPRNVQKCSPKESKTEEQLLEMEMLFYSHLSGNIQENLANHLDGKIDKSGNPVRTDQIADLPDSTKASSLLVATPSAGVPDVQISRAPSPYQTRSKTPNPLPPTAKKFKKLPNWQQKFWEKYNFPTNYRLEHRFWDKNYLNTEKSAFYLKDLSCLDIKTQLTMRENIKKLDEIKKIEENTKPADNHTFPDYLSLVPKINKVNSTEIKVDLQKNISECSKNKKQTGKEEPKKSFKSPGSDLPLVKNRIKMNPDNSSSGKKQTAEGVKMMTRRQSSLELIKDDKEENSKKRKGSLDLTGGQRMALRRQTSLDNLGSAVSKVEKNEQLLDIYVNNTDVDNTPPSPTGSAEISGEWVRPRSYLCGTCCTKFTNLWELEDHKWVSHPNVWCTHYEFEDEKIDKLFQKNEDEGTDKDPVESSELSKSKLADLYKRYLLPHGSLKTAKLVPKTNFPEQCTKCKKNCINSSEMHKHMLDCGGDTTWFLTMYSSPMTIKRKWRPFGSRRKKQIGRRDVKRNIPSTPTLRSYHYQHRIRTKPGDVETIQKMLANLPEKRARRAINFDEIKTRSQATIHSNRLLRKRFKTSFSNNFLKLRNLKQKRQLKHGKKEGSSKSTTDTSSESTPVGSPKRRNKLKEGFQLLKEETSRDGFSETSEDVNVKVTKKKVQNKKKASTTHKNESPKIEKTKIKKENQESNTEKPVTRSNVCALPIESNKTKRKTFGLQEEIMNGSECGNSELVDNKEQKNASKPGKKAKKKSSKTPVKKEMTVSKSSDICSDPNISKVKETAVKIGKRIRLQEVTETEVKTSNNNSHWVSGRCNPILRLRQNNKAKTELLKTMQKKLKNSRKILKKKEVKKAEAGSRRSSRLRSLQQIENDFELCDNFKPVTGEKDLKMKNVVVSLQNAALCKSVKSSNGKNMKAADQKVEKEMSESPTIRRSLRNSISLEEKPDLLKNDSIVSFNPRSVLRRNLRNEKSDIPLTDPVEDVLPTFINDLNIRNIGGSTPQVTLLKKNRFQNPKTLRGVVKSEELSRNADLNTDLEEMPILAKVEPIRKKVFDKNEKEIPVLLPVEKDQKKCSEEESQIVEDSISFQVIKKRRKNLKEITPLKIVKKVESVTREGGNDGKVTDSGVNYQEELSETGNIRKKKKLSEGSDTREKGIKTDVKKYFLGIDPTEIDKGRKEGQDESGSDNEPLICLINNQLQSYQFTQKEERRKLENHEASILIESVVQKCDSQSKEMPTEPLIFTSHPEERYKEVPAEATQKRTIKKTKKLRKKLKSCKKKKKTPVRVAKELRMTVSLKEPTIKIIEKPVNIGAENKLSLKSLELETKEESVNTAKIEECDSFIVEEATVLPQRRSRRISKETKASNEFVIDDPLILVDELWSDLDSDSDSARRKGKKGKKKSPKKKAGEEKRISDINLEELLRNFGENKEAKKSNVLNVKVIRSRDKILHGLTEIRKSVENRKARKSYKRLSLKLFRFNKISRNFGNSGVKLSEAKKALQQELDQIQAQSGILPDLPFLTAEIKENPVQVIQCGGQKPKPSKKGVKKGELKCQNSEIHMKISLPLEIVNNMTLFNNNHLTEPILEIPKQSATATKEITQFEYCKSDRESSCLWEIPLDKEKQTVEEDASAPVSDSQDASDVKNKSKRSEVIDKIFYCEICKTYYYSPSQLKIHKLSNRHKLKEFEMQQTPLESETNEHIRAEISKSESLNEFLPAVEKALEKPAPVENAEVEKLNEDTLEMPTLEGPFIENPLTSLTASEPVQTPLPLPPPPPPPPPPPVSSFSFSQENLKDIQKAIGCTDEEMLILTLLGENTIEIESDILDLDLCKSTQSKPSKSQKEKAENSLRENEKRNGAFSIDLKQRMTSALTCLVNKAVFNLLQKYETAARSAVNPEALSLLGKLSNLSRRKNILQLNELLKKRNDGESSMGVVSKDLEKKEPTVSYKYQCTICGSRFEKASTRECHISRSHKGKAKKVGDEVQASQTTQEEEWTESWNYDARDDHLGSSSATQFWCSDCGINFLSPQEVLEHQKLEHQAAALKEPESNKDSGPLQSSTIGSSDEILEGKKTRRRPKLFSSEELDQQRIIANNELRKLDRKFSSKNKSSKIKWGMDALKFTVEKENKLIVEEEDREIAHEEPLKPSADVKNIDLVPKLNLSRISNIPEFKVIQKNSFENRFQKIIDNKLKRKCICPSQEENATDEVEEEVMLVPVVVKKKNKKQKASKCLKKEESGKPLDVYDFNESESEGEPAVYSHIKKLAPSPTKLKLVKIKEGPSKNKADSTTKDLAPDDYDSEDSLPLSVVKKSKPGEEDDEKDEKVSDDGVEKSDGILEQVEYLIEQLENETGSSKKENDGNELEREPTKPTDLGSYTFTPNESLRVSVANKFLELDELQLKNPITDETDQNKLKLPSEEKSMQEMPERDSVLPEPESSQSTFDEEDSIPLVMISRKADKSKFSQEEKKNDENVTDVSTTASEDISLTRTEGKKSSEVRDSSINVQTGAEESFLPSTETDDVFCEKPGKPFETLNGNVIYCRNDSITDFESDLSSDIMIDSIFDKTFVKEVTEKEDVVIVCSKRVEEESDESKGSGIFGNAHDKEEENSENFLRKKKRFPLLTATIEENNFRRSETPNSNKEVIVRKIWNRKKLTEESTDEDSYVSLEGSNISVESVQDDDIQTEIEKEIIVKKIWSRKKHESEDEVVEKVEENFDDIKINQTEVSDEVVIKCGPKAKSPKRRKSKSSTNEASKDTIMRKIWSGKCTFQTKAALKTYDSDMLPNCKENDISGAQIRSKRRGRPSSFSSTKRIKVENEVERDDDGDDGDDGDDDDDDLDSLLEEIEREQLEKAIRSEFLQLRRSEKANVESKEVAAPSVGLFTETAFNPRKEILDKKRRKTKKKIKHPRQSVLKRKKLIRKPFRRVLPSEERNFSESTNRTNLEGSTEPSESSLDKTISFGAEGKTKNRKHKKHRHKHHHHKHKHKKSKHHKSVVGKHKTKHELEGKDEEQQQQQQQQEQEQEQDVEEEDEGAREGGREAETAEKSDSFTILEKICQDIPNHIENESHLESRTFLRKSTSDAGEVESKVVDMFSTFGSGRKEDFENEGRRYENSNVYEFVEDVQDFSVVELKNLRK